MTCAAKLHSTLSRSRPLPTRDAPFHARALFQLGQAPRTRTLCGGKNLRTSVLQTEGADRLLVHGALVRRFFLAEILEQLEARLEHLRDVRAVHVERHRLLLVVEQIFLQLLADLQMRIEHLVELFAAPGAGSGVLAGVLATLRVPHRDHLLGAGRVQFL